MKTPRTDNEFEPFTVSVNEGMAPGVGNFGGIHSDHSDFAGGSAPPGHDSAPLLEAARRLGSGTDLLVVCDDAGRLVGVLTKTDVVKQIGHCQGAGCMALLLIAMTRDVLSCRGDDGLETVWALMRDRGLKNVPVVDAADHPIGIVNARDMLQAQLSASTNEEALLRDYVMGIGYR